MHVINLRMHELRKLKELPLEEGVLNTEALMLVLKRRSFPDRHLRVFKYLDCQDDKSIMSKKLYTVMTLNHLDDYQEISELVIPDAVIYVQNHIAGFGIPLISNHRNLGAIIHDDHVSLKQKLSYLEQLGTIIDKVERVHISGNRFQFGDLNEYNFIVDQDNHLKAIDLDSAYLGVGEPLHMAYYLLKNQYVKSIPEKYKSTDRGIIIPSDNTDLYCYNMIILNALSGENLYRHSIDTYYQYLDYITSLGLPNEIIRSFQSIYIPKKNINPREYLEDIDTNLAEEYQFQKFVKKRLL